MPTVIKPIMPAKNINIKQCQGWWITENIDLNNSEDQKAIWVKSQCSIEIPSNENLVVPAKEVDFSSVTGQLVMYNKWSCNLPETTWKFDFNTCKWSNGVHSEALLEDALLKETMEVRQSHFLG